MKIIVLLNRIVIKDKIFTDKKEYNKTKENIFFYFFCSIVFLLSGRRSLYPVRHITSYVKIYIIFSPFAKAIHAYIKAIQKMIPIPSGPLLLRNSIDPASLISIHTNTKLAKYIHLLLANINIIEKIKNMMITIPSLL